MKHFFQKYTPELIILLIITVFFTAELINNRFWLNDFRVYYTAAKQFIYGENVYGEAYGLDSGFYKYSPFALLFFIPFTLFSFKTAAIIYYFLVAVAILFLFQLIKSLLNQYLIPLTKGQRLIVTLVGFLILANHFFRELHLGNINALLLLLALCSFVLLLKERKILGGIVLAFCILFKPHFVILIPIFALRKEYKFLVSMSLSLLVGLFLPALFIGLGKNAQLFTDWMHTISSHNSLSSDFTNTIYCWIHQVLSKMGIAISEKTLSLLVLTAVGVFFFIFWFKHSAKEKQNSSIRNSNFLIEYFLLLACIPNLTKTDTEHFLLSLPLILFLLAFICSQKLSKWVLVLVIIGFVAYGANWYDLVGKQISVFWNNWGLVGIGNWLLIILAAIFYNQFSKSKDTISA